MSLATDGSSAEDARPRVRIDADSATDRWRFRCPHGHATWSPTNGGIWCQSCSRDHGIRDPQHHEVLDTKTGQRVAWADVEFR